MIAALIGGTISFFLNLQPWLLTVIFVGLLIMLFTGISYLVDSIKKRSRRKYMDEKDKKNINISGEAIVSIGQQGGQTARNIYNVGIQPQRNLSITDSIVQQLSQYHDTPYGIAWVYGDNESQLFASQIDTMLQASSWRRIDAGRATIMPRISYGVDLRWRDDSGYGDAMLTLMACLKDMGFTVQRTNEKRLQDPEIFVRSNKT